MAPQLTATGAAQGDGLVGDGHVMAIRSFFAHLPAAFDLCTRQAAEADLAVEAGGCRHGELAKYAQRIMDWLNPDGEFSDQERARKRCVMLGKPELDSMSRISGYLTPEARAAFEPVPAKLGAPGMCNPADETPAVDEEPSRDAVCRDNRSQVECNHDGLRALVVPGRLGQHNGLPVSTVVTTTLAELEAGAGKGLTGGVTLPPMSDVIRMAGHAHHDLAIFDHGKAPALDHAKRLASPHSESCCTPKTVLVVRRGINDLLSRGNGSHRTGRRGGRGWYRRLRQRR